MLKLHIFYKFIYVGVAMNLYNKVFCYIASHKKGWVFSPSDLTHKFPRQQVDNALSHLVKDGRIRRIARGMYDYPSYSKALQIQCGPSAKMVKQTLARKYHWKTEIFSEYALNYFGLSTQIVAKNIYLSSGPNRIYTLFNGVSIEFQNVPLKTIDFKYRISTIVVQALRALGKEHIDNKVINKIRAHIPLNMRTKIVNDTKNTTAWIHKAIIQICRS